MNTLIEKLSQLELASHEMLLCRLGQHSFLVRIKDKIAAFDPYLTADANRLIPPLFAPEEFKGVDLVCCSHDHGDHIDRPALAAMAEASPQAVFVVPQAVKSSITEIPQSRMTGMNDGETLELCGMTVSAVAAAHEMLDETPEGLFPYLGYILSYDGVSVYHSGDCCVYEGLLTRLKANLPDVMLLPINGRDARRLRNNCIGNMTYQEAADLAGWSGVGWVIPTHYDMFAGNLEDPQLFMDYLAVKYPAVSGALLAPGEIFRLKAGR